MKPLSAQRQIFFDSAPELKILRFHCWSSHARVSTPFGWGGNVRCRPSPNCVFTDSNLSLNWEAADGPAFVGARCMSRSLEDGVPDRTAYEACMRDLWGQSCKKQGWDVAAPPPLSMAVLRCRVYSASAMSCRSTNGRMPP